MGHLEGPTGVKEVGFLFTPEVGVCVPYWEAAGYKAIRAAAHKASEGQWHRGHGIYWRSGGRQEENARSDLDFFNTSGTQSAPSFIFDILLAMVSLDRGNGK